MKIIAPLVLCAVFGTAHAQQIDESSARAVIIVPSAEEQANAAAAERALAERRQQMIDECLQYHGSQSDCERETDTELRAERLQSGGGPFRLGAPR